MREVQELPEHMKNRPVTVRSETWKLTGETDCMRVYLSDELPNECLVYRTFEHHLGTQEQMCHSGSIDSLKAFYDAYGAIKIAMDGVQHAKSDH